MFRKKTAPPEVDDDAAAVLPEAAADAEADFESVYLGRQPILDRQGALVAFELLFRNGDSNRAIVTDDREATAQVIIRTRCELA